MGEERGDALLGLACIELGGGRQRPTTRSIAWAHPGRGSRQASRRAALALVHAAGESDAGRVCELLVDAFVIADRDAQTPRSWSRASETSMDASRYASHWLSSPRHSRPRARPASDRCRSPHRHQRFPWRPRDRRTTLSLADPGAAPGQMSVAVGGAAALMGRCSACGRVALQLHARGRRPRGRRAARSPLPAESTVEILNDIGLEASSFSNHEFDGLRRDPAPDEGGCAERSGSPRRAACAFRTAARNSVPRRQRRRAAETCRRRL